MLRDYQQRAIDMVYDWMRRHDGHPCLVLPTGAGKSHIVAAICKDALQNWPETRVLMLTHVKELIEQNAEKMRQHWPQAPLGICSASMGKKELGYQITFAGIQSVRTKAQRIGHIDLVIIDECHLVSHRAEGGYRQLLAELAQINPALRVIGLTATPYRLGHGYIIGDDALFDGLVEPVGVLELIERGFLAPLRSKITAHRIDASDVKKRGGEYVERDLAQAVDTHQHNTSVVDEVIRLAGDRKAWLFFCVGIDHAQHVAECLRTQGISAECVTGETPKRERERIIDDYRAGRIRALTNANVLTTGFDYPDIDLIALLRPTESPTLYVQMVGRGLRPKSHTDHCLVLDFVGMVQRHGPITDVTPPEKAGDGTGDAPVKTCPECAEIVHTSVKQCPACGFLFPASEPPRWKLHDQDIMGDRPETMRVTSWRWRVHTSRTSGKEMLRVTYYGSLADPPVSEYLGIAHGGTAQEMALRRLFTLARDGGMDTINLAQNNTLSGVADAMQSVPPPSEIDYKRDGKWHRVVQARWLLEEPA
jgi:DNA repair protein RadD